jgi:amidohydrolase
MKFKQAMMAPLLLAPFLFAQAGIAQLPALPTDAQSLVDAVMPQVIEWRRDFHQHPELGNREFRTSAIIAEHLQSLGMDVQTGIAHTGVVAILRGGRPGPVVALRADMDGLPVEERADVPFASRVRTEYNGQDVGVMHACGHDNHMAILMGAATALAGMRDTLPGTVMFIFQPAEEGAPEGEEGGAELMLKEGLFDTLKPDAVFGLHVWPIPAGQIAVREGGTMASSDSFRIRVQGQQTHGAAPWAGIDPIVVAAQIVMGLQTITSRQLDSTLTPSIVTVGAINGGLRSNIIPDYVDMIGTLRTFDAETRRQIHERVERTATQIAASAGASVDVSVSLGYPVTYNDPQLTRTMSATLQRVVGERLVEASLITGAEDFSYLANEVPGMFFFLGVGADDPALVYPNHSPYFYADERALPVGVTAMTALALDFLNERQ